MAQIKLNVIADTSKATANLKTLETQIKGIADNLAKTTTAKGGLTAPLNETGKAAKASAQNVDTLRKSYANLLAQIKTLEKQYGGEIFKGVKKEVDAHLQQIKNLTAADKENSQVLGQLSKDYKKLAADVAQYRAEETKLATADSLIPKTGNTLSRLESGWSNLANSIKNVEKYYPKGTFDAIKTQIDAQANSVAALRAEYNANNKTLSDQSIKIMNDSTAALLEQRAAFDKTKNSATNYHGSLRDLITGFAKFQLSAMLVMKPLQLLTSAWQSLNEALVETEKVVVSLQRVLDEDVASGEISSELYAIAQNLGQSFDNVQEIAQNFAKAGLSWQDTLEATKAAVLALNVAELTAEESSEGLIAVMQQFNYEASELTYVIDVLNKAADKSAVDTQELLVALQKTGSYASAANLSLEQTVGLISALSEATAASGQNIGNALKSLFAYSSKSSSLEMFASLSEEMKAIVDMYQIGNASILDVWEKLAATMENLSAEQANLLEQWSSESGLETELGSALGDVYDQLTGVYDTAGVYRKNYFIALLNNFEEVRDVMDEISDAQGYTDKEQAKYMDTYEAKLNSLQAKWEEIANDEQGLLGLKKGLLDFGNAILTVIEWTGGLRTTFIALGTVVAALFGSKIISGIKSIGIAFTQILSPLSNFKKYSELAAEAQAAQALATSFQTEADQRNLVVQNLKNAANATGAQIEAAETAAITANTLAQQANAAATQKAALAAQSFGSAVNTALGIIGIVTTVISAVVGAIQQANEEAQRAAEETRQAAIDSWESIKDETTELASLYSELEAFSNKQSLTVDEEEAYTQVQEDIISLLGDRASALKTLTEGTEEYTQKLKELTQEELKERADKAQASATSLWSEFLGTIIDLGTGVINGKFSNFAFKQFQQSESLGDYFSTGIDKILEEYAKTYGEYSNEYVGAVNDLYAAKDAYEAAIKGLVESNVADFLYTNGTDITIDDIDKIAADIVAMTGAGEEYRDIIKGWIIEYSGFEEVVEDTKDDQIKAIEYLKDKGESLADTLRDIREEQAKTLDLEEKQLDIAETKEELAEAEAEAAEKLAEAQKELTEAQDKLNQERLDLLDKQQEALDDLKEAQDDLKKAQDAVLEAQEKYAEAQEKITDAEKSINEERLSLLEQQKTAQEAINSAQQDAEEARLDLLEKQQAVLEAQKALEEARNNRSRYVFNNATGQWEWRENQKDIQEAQEELEAAQEAEAEAKEQYENTLQAIKDVETELENINATIADAEKAVQEAIDKGFNISKEILEEQTNIATGVRDAIESYIEATENAEDAKEEITDAEEDVISAQDKVNAAQEIVAQYQAAIAQAEEAIRQAIENGAAISADISEANTSLAQGVLDAIAAVQEAQQGIEDQKAENAETIAAAQESVQEAIDSLNEYIEDQAWDEVISELESGKATNESIKGIIDEWKQIAEEQGATNTEWYKEIVEAIYDAVDIEIADLDKLNKEYASTNNNKGFNEPIELGDSYSSILGKAQGIENFHKGASGSAVTIIGTDFGKKLLEGNSDEAFKSNLRNLGILSESARTTTAPIYQTTDSKTITTNNNSSININGVKIGNDRLTHTLGEVLQEIGLVP